MADKMGHDERKHGAVRDVAMDAGDEAFARAASSGDPACTRHADALRAQLEAWVDGVRAGAGLRAASAAAHRRRRAADHREMALEFAQRRKVAVGLEGDELCRSVQAAMDARVVGSCAYCGCNFSVVAVADLPGLGGVCGVCGRRVRVHDPSAAAGPRPPGKRRGEMERVAAMVAGGASAGGGLPQVYLFVGLFTTRPTC